MNKTNFLIGSLCLGLLGGCSTRDTSSIVHGRFRLASSLNQNTPFGKYDATIVQAVTEKWYAILTSNKFAKDRTGKVVLRFKLHPDGTVTDLISLESNAGDVLTHVCHESIKEAAPFAPWPPDMEKLIGVDYREITFAFYHY